MKYLQLGQNRYIRTAISVGALVLGQILGAVNAQPALVERVVVDPEVLAAALPDSLGGELGQRNSFIAIDGSTESDHAVSRAFVRTESYLDEGTSINVFAKTIAGDPESFQDVLARYEPEEISEELIQGFSALVSRGDRNTSTTRWTARVHLSDKRRVLVRSESRPELLEVLGQIDLRALATVSADSIVFIDPEIGKIFAGFAEHDAYLQAIAPRVIHAVPAVKLELFLPEAPYGHTRVYERLRYHSIASSIDGQPARARTRAGFSYWNETIGREKRVRLIIEDVDSDPGRNQEVLRKTREQGYAITSIREYPAFLRVEPPTNSFTQPDSFLVVLVGDRRRIAISRPNTSLAVALLDSLDIERLASLSPRIQAIHGNPQWHGNEMRDISWERVIGAWRPDSLSRPNRFRVELGWWQPNWTLRDPLEFTLPSGWHVDNLLEAECNATASRALVVMSTTPADLCRWNGRFHELVRVQPIIALDEVENGQQVPSEWLERWDGYALSKLPRWMFRWYDVSFAEVGRRSRELMGGNVVVWLEAEDSVHAVRLKVGFVEIDGATYMGTALATEGHIESTFRALRDVLSSLTTVQ